MMGHTNQGIEIYVRCGFWYNKRSISTHPQRATSHVNAHYIPGDRHSGFAKQAIKHK